MNMRKRQDQIRGSWIILVYLYAHSKMNTAASNREPSICPFCPLKEDNENNVTAVRKACVYRIVFILVIEIKSYCLSVLADFSFFYKKSYMLEKYA